MKRFTKLMIIFAISLSVVSLFCGCGSEESVRNSEIPSSDKSFAEMSTEELSPYLEYAEKAVEKYFLLRMSSDCVSEKKTAEESPELSPETILSEKTLAEIDKMPLSAFLKTYMKSRLAYESEQHFIKDFYEVYCEGKFAAETVGKSDDILVCGVSAEIKFRYSDNESPAFSSFFIQVVLKNPKNPEIVDWYDGSPESFDSIVRSPGLYLLDFGSILNDSDSNEIREKIGELFKR